MGDHFHFGGGSAESTMHPVVLVATLLAVLGMLRLPRKYALLPAVAVVFLTPTGQQVLIGGFHFFVMRMLVVIGLARIAWAKASGKTRIFSNGVQLIDRLFFAWAILHAATFVLLFKDMGAVTYEIAFLLDACGYMMFRHFIQDREDVLRITKTLAVAATVLGICMGYEYLTRVNVFSYISSYHDRAVGSGRESPCAGYILELHYGGSIWGDVASAVFLVVEEWQGKIVGNLGTGRVRHHRGDVHGQHRSHGVSCRNSGAVPVAHS